MKSSFKKFILYYFALSLCNIKICLLIWILSVTNMQKIKKQNKKKAKLFHSTVTALNLLADPDSDVWYFLHLLQV